MAFSLWSLAGALDLVDAVASGKARGILENALGLRLVMHDALQRADGLSSCAIWLSWVSCLEDNELEYLVRDSMGFGLE